MASYKCKKCGGKMSYSHSTRKGDHYKCESCGHSGFVDGMEEDTEGPDLGTFGL